MSLLSPDWSAAARIGLLPGRASLAVGGRPPAGAEGGVGWDGALAALDGLLAGQRGRGRAAVTLSHHFVRLFLLEPPPTWLRRAEMAAWLADRLADPLGAGGGWRHVWRDVPPGRPVPVCAMEAARLEELNGLLARHGLRASHVRPWLDAAWARRRHQLRRASTWYALLEPGAVSLLRVERGRPTLLRQRQMSADPAAELAGLLSREALLAGQLAEGEVWIERAGVGADWQRLGSGWRVRELAGPTEPGLALVQ